MIYSADSPGSDFFCLLFGRVTVSVNDDDEPLATLVDHSHFGEVEAVRGCSRVTTVTAVGPTHVIRVQQRVYISHWPQYTAHRQFVESVARSALKKGHASSGACESQSKLKRTTFAGALTSTGSDESWS